jgi:Uma2 family endonuclease
MNYSIKKDNKLFTYGDYLSWDDGLRWELINGEAYDMSPAPSRMHQEISGDLFRQISSYLIDKPCKVYSAPFDVRLPESNEKDEDVTTVVQPDIVVVCDKSKLDEKGCKGAPDLVVEIVSPSTASMDYIKKLELYEKSHVKEYWIVHPVDHIAMLYKIQDDGRYGRPEMYSDKDQINVGIFSNDLVIDLKNVFKD